MKAIRNLIGIAALSLLFWAAGNGGSETSGADTLYRQDYGGMAGAELIDTAANRISGKVEVLYPLFDRLRKMERQDGGAMIPFDASRELITILHLGDSHVQGGIFPGQLRTRLQGRFGSAGRGLLTPYRLMKTNQPPGYELSSSNSWTGSRCIELNPELETGLTGAAITTSEKNIELSVGSPDEPFMQVTVFSHPQAPLLSAGEWAAEIGCPDGDSPTMTRISLRETTDRVTLRGDLSDPEYTVPVYYGFSLENGRPGVLYHSVGINGNTCQALTRNPQIIAQAAQLSPDLILISLGTNDSYGRNFNPEQVEEQFRQLITLCRTSAPESIVLLTTPMECYSRFRSGRRTTFKVNPNLEKTRQVILETAHREGLPCWDFYAASGGEGAMERWSEATLARPDKIHLTPEGYVLQGEMLYQALMEAYANYLTD